MTSRTCLNASHAIRILEFFTDSYYLAAIIGLIGILITYFFVPNLKGEDLAIEDEKFRAYLVQHGWVGVMGEEDLKAFADAGIPPALVQDPGHKFSGVPEIVAEGKAHLKTG